MEGASDPEGTHIAGKAFRPNLGQHVLEARERKVSYNQPDTAAKNPFNHRW